jgi:integrase
MTQLRLRYVVEDMDRHGNVRVYFRRKGARKIRLPGLPGSDEFIEAYRAALAGVSTKSTGRSASRQRSKHGSFRWLCEAYYKSAEFKRLDGRTQRIRRNLLDALCEQHGDKPAARMESRHVRALRNERANKPEAANAVLKAVRQVYSFGTEAELIDHNPARDVSYIKSGSQGFHSWTLEEVRQFEERHPIGTKARLAMALLLYTGQRRSDVILFGRQRLRDGWLTFTQQKNRNRKPISLSFRWPPHCRQLLPSRPAVI